MSYIDEVKIGTKYGEWTIIDKVPNTTRSVVVRCKCGLEKKQDMWSLIYGKTKRCKECLIQDKRDSFIGKKVGTLLVKEYAGLRKGSRGGMAHHFLCLCDCGQETIVRIDNLSPTARPRKTCGCGRGGENSFAWMGYKELPGVYMSSIKKRARNANLECSITKEYLMELFEKQDRKCALTGRLLTLHSKGEAGIGASLDRIDSSKGYIEGNVQWVLKYINIAKYTLSQEEFIGICKEVVDHASKCI